MPGKMILLPFNVELLNATTRYENMMRNNYNGTKHRENNL